MLDNWVGLCYNVCKIKTRITVTEWRVITSNQGDMTMAKAKSWSDKDTLKATLYLEAMPSRELLELSGFTLGNTTGERLTKTPFKIELSQVIDYQEAYETATDEEIRDAWRDSFDIAEQAKMRQVASNKLSLSSDKVTKSINTGVDLALRSLLTQGLISQVEFDIQIAKLKR